MWMLYIDKLWSITCQYIEVSFNNLGNESIIIIIWLYHALISSLRSFPLSIKQNFHSNKDSVKVMMVQPF